MIGSCVGERVFIKSRHGALRGKHKGAVKMFTQGLARELRSAAALRSTMFQAGAH